MSGAPAEAEDHGTRMVPVLFDMETMETCLYWALRNALGLSHEGAEEWAHSMSCANCNKKANPPATVSVVAQAVAATLAALKEMGKLGEDTVRDAKALHQVAGTNTKQ